MIYLIGSLRNPNVPKLANWLRADGFEVFDEWYAPGKLADEEWQAYEIARGRTYREALEGAHARDIFEFDKYYLDQADCAVLLAPAGKSAHMELGYTIGKGKPAYILMEHEPDRYDIMMRFATKVCLNYQELKEVLSAIQQ